MGRSSLKPPASLRVFVLALASHQPSTHMNSLPGHSRKEIWQRGGGVCGLVLLDAPGKPAYTTLSRPPPDPLPAAPLKHPLHYYHHNIHTHTKPKKHVKAPVEPLPLSSHLFALLNPPLPILRHPAPNTQRRTTHHVRVDVFRRPASRPAHSPGSRRRHSPCSCPSPPSQTAPAL